MGDSVQSVQCGPSLHLNPRRILVLVLLLEISTIINIIMSSSQEPSGTEHNGEHERDGGPGCRGEVVLISVRVRSLFVSKDLMRS